MISAVERDAAKVASFRGNWTRTVLIAGAVAAVVLGLLAGTLAVSDRIGALVGLLALILPVVLWRRPAIGVLGLGTAGLLIEQYRIGAPGGDVTDHIPWFTSLSDGFKLQGVYANPAELGIILLLLVLAARAAVTHRFVWPDGYVGAGFIAVLLALTFGVVHGAAASGNFTMILWEIRPFLYVFLTYFLVLQLNPSTRTLEAFYWCVVIGTGIKALQGLLALIPILSGAVPRPDFLLSHDDAFFFGMDILLVASLWLFGQKSRLRTVATMLLPLVVVINLANSRRTAWLILGAGILITIVMVYVRFPERRWSVARLVVIAAAVFAIYLQVFWNASGFLAQPARAIQSAVAPSQRDRLSDQYRVSENANLTLAIRASPLGAGFGVPINYVVPIVDLTRSDPFLRYITHDGILYVWMRMGWLGFIAWWSLIGFVLISASQLLRSRDLRLACFASFTAACVAGYVIEGFYDLGLFWFRMAFFVGLVIGLLQMAQRIEAAKSEVPAPEATSPMKPMKTLAAAPVGGSAR